MTIFYAAVVALRQFSQKNIYPRHNSQAYTMLSNRFAVYLPHVSQAVPIVYDPIILFQKYIQLLIIGRKKKL